MAAEGMKKTIWLPIKGAFSDLVIWRSVICCRILEEYPSGVRVTCQLVTDTNTPAGKKERLHQAAMILFFCFKSSVKLLNF